MLSKPIDQITAADIKALVEHKIQENHALEYKSRLPGKAESDKIKFLAEISAFANTRGGLLLAGISDAEGVPGTICGIESDDLDAEMLRIEQIIRNGLSPRVEATLRVITVDQTTVVAIEVSKSWVGPHMISLNDHSKFYGRNSAGKYPMDVYEIRDAFLSSATIPERMRQIRRDRAKKLSERHELPLSLHGGSLLALHLIPLAAFGVEGSAIVSNEMLHRSRLRPPGASGWDSRVNLDGLVTFSARIQETSKSYAQLFRSGMIEAVASVGHQDQEGKLFVYGSTIEKYLIESLRSYLEFYTEADIPGPYYCFVTLTDVLAAHMYLDRLTLAGSDPLVSDRSIISVPEVIIEEPTVDPVKILRPIVDLIWNAFGVNQSPNFDGNGKWVPRN